MSATARPIVFSRSMVLGLVAGLKTVVRLPVSIDDTPISEADAKACRFQRGIPSNAQNVRLGWPYLKCDAPEGLNTLRHGLVSFSPIAPTRRSRQRNRQGRSIPARGFSSGARCASRT